MSRMIDADALKDRIRSTPIETDDHEMYCLIRRIDNAFIELIDSIPTIESPSISVVLGAIKASLENGNQHIMIDGTGNASIWPQTKTANWIKKDDSGQVTCSGCGGVSCCAGNYCPDCGAEMLNPKKWPSESDDTK